MRAGAHTHALLLTPSPRCYLQVKTWHDATVVLYVGVMLCFILACAFSFEIAFGIEQGNFSSITRSYMSLFRMVGCARPPPPTTMRPCCPRRYVPFGLPRARIDAVSGATGCPPHCRPPLPGASDLLNK